MEMNKIAPTIKICPFHFRFKLIRWNWSSPVDFRPYSSCALSQTSNFPSLTNGSSTGLAITLCECCQLRTSADLELLLMFFFFYSALSLTSLETTQRVECDGSRPYDLVSRLVTGITKSENKTPKSTLNKTKYKKKKCKHLQKGLTH